MPYTFKHGDRPLDGITIQRAVGRGGFGEVYYAVADSGKQVALKYLRDNPEVELRGIAHVMNLKSPHLITIYDVRASIAGEPFVVMEYVSGPSLRELLLADPGGLGPQKAAFFVDGVARGLAYLHDRGIVHRDLKPANIFYDDGYVKIGDYGLSKHISVSKHSGQTVSVGTVHYMAPEIGSGSYTKAIDIYALGVILYELLTGRLPFTGSSMGEILMRHLSDSPDVTGIPEPFAAVIAKALSKDPNDRYQDANEMVAALRQHEDFSASVASFDPATLTSVPRRPVAADPERTMTTPPARVPPLPPLDVRAPVTPRGGPDSLTEKLQKKADKLSHKFEKKVAKLGGKWERQRRHSWMSPPPPAQAPAPAPQPVGRHGRKSQIFILLAVAAAVGIGLAVLSNTHNTEEAAVGLVFAMLAATFGPLLTYFKFLVRSPARSPMWDRLAYTALTALFMIPALAAGADVSGDFQRMLLAPLAMLLLCNWTERIEAGRRGDVRGGQAFWPAVTGLIVAAVAGAEGLVLISAAMCATISLLTQAGAALWPVAASGYAPRGGRWRRTSWFGWRRHAGGRASAADVSADPACGVCPPCTAEPTDSEYDAPPAGPSVPRSSAVRVIFGILATLALIGSLGSFFVLMFARGDCPDDCAGLLFGTLAGVVWMPFLLTKALHQYKLPLWRGTLRMFTVSVGLSIAAGMIALLVFKHALMESDEEAGVIFGLVAGGVLALAALCVPGARRRGATPRAFRRALFGALVTLALAGSLGAFFALVIAQPGAGTYKTERTYRLAPDGEPFVKEVFRPDTDASAGLLFAALAGVAWLPFLLSKALQRRKLPLWRGTLRMLTASLGLCLAAGMIAVLAFQRPTGDDLGAAIFGLVAGGVTALVAFCVPGPGLPRPVAEPPAGRLPEPGAPEPEPTGAAPEERADVSERRADASEQPADRHEPQVLIDASAPSFVGRTVNAGVSFLGKLLMVLGLVLAVGHDAIRDKADSVFEQTHVYQDQPEFRGIVTAGIPGPLLMGVTTLGCLLLVLARRRDGGAHLLRGCLGCALVLWAAVMALGPAAGACHELFSQSDWSQVQWPQVAQPLIVVAVPLAAAFILLTWPRRRPGQTIVV